VPSSKAAAAISASLRRLYGPSIAVRYHDLSHPATRYQAGVLLHALRDERLPLPVTLLDGRVIFAGAIDPLRVVAVVAEELHRRQEDGSDR
jgi:disulfide oxidoreductase YuzD